jgi:hypothetical protein
MRNFLKGKKGLSTVVTTLIILVVAVLLATVVTYYAINMTTTSVQEEDLQVSNANIWANSSIREAAFVIVNIGGRDALIDKIQVRGQDMNWSNVYYKRSLTAPAEPTIISNLTAASEPTYTYNSTTLPHHVISTTPATLDNASLPTGHPLDLQSGTYMLVYIRNPGTISVEDVGTTCSITVFSAQAEYKVEVNVESAS